MTDRLGWRRKFGVIAPSTNTIVQPEFDMMRVPGVTSHYGRILIRDGRIGDDKGMEALLEQIRASMADCVEGIMTMEPDYMVMGMSAETFWDGVEGNRQFVQQIKDLSGGLGVATGAEACERALHLYGAKKIAVVTPYTPIGDTNVRKFFTELGFEVGQVKGLSCESAVAIAHVSEQTLRESLTGHGLAGLSDDAQDAAVDDFRRALAQWAVRSAWINPEQLSELDDRRP